MEADILITVALATGVVLIINQLSRLRRAAILHKTIRDAIHVDSGAVPSLIERIDEKQDGGGDDRIGLILLALAAALIGFGLIEGDPDDIKRMTSIALFPGFVGAVLLARAWYLKRAGAGN